MPWSLCSIYDQPALQPERVETAWHLHSFLHEPPAWPQNPSLLGSLPLCPQGWPPFLGQNSWGGGLEGSGRLTPGPQGPCQGVCPDDKFRAPRTGSQDGAQDGGPRQLDLYPESATQPLRDLLGNPPLLSLQGLLTATPACQSQ